MPTRNRAAALSRRVPELLAQTFTDFELVIVDDGSSDDTAEVARAATEQDPRIRYVPLRPGVGIPRVLQRCLTEARAELIAIFHDHDSYAPTVIERLTQALLARPEAGFAHTAIRIIGADGATEHIWPAGFGERYEILDIVLRTGACPVCASAVMVRRGRLPAEPFDERLGLFADVRLWCELSAAGPSVYVPEALVTVRGWCEAEALGKLNWGAIGDLAALRREFAARRYSDGVKRTRLRTMIQLTTACERVKFLGRLVVHRLRGGQAPKSALDGMPTILAVTLMAVGTVADGIGTMSGSP